MGSRRKMFLNYFCFTEILSNIMYMLVYIVLTYSDFSFDNVNFDLRKSSGVK